MSEGKEKDAAIKLFGKTISLPAILPTSMSGGSSSPPKAPPYDLAVDRSLSPSLPNSSPEDTNMSRAGEDEVPDEGASGGREIDAKRLDGPKPITVEEMADSNATATVNDSPNAQSVDSDATTSKTSKTLEEQSQTSNSQDKTLKKPDKILPCPRCNSMDTKFCYYNNYNVNQPRHYCKNCQRYWTAGGTMRNVPVGAGRRKNKNSTSHNRHITVPEASQNPPPILPNAIHHPSLKPNGNIPTFGIDLPLCESMASVLNIAEKTKQNCAQNGFHVEEELRVPVSCRDGDNGDDHSSRSTDNAANSEEDPGKNAAPNPIKPNHHSFPPQVPCFSVASWPYPWNSAKWSSQVPPPAFCPPGFPMPFYPAPAYWGCTLPGAWNVPLVAPAPTSPKHTGPSSGPNSPTLGKHSRDENLMKLTDSREAESQNDNTERCLWIPKTLRIDDPGEAARSSILATLGIKNDKADSVSRASPLKPFQSKSNEKNHISEASPALQANPAALSRSFSFHENS
ncbi:hypothetical protein NMG60_11028428 [Bertholletia excelsa]